MFLHDKILKGFDKALMTGMILIDLHRALDMIDHDLLLKKLSTIGFSNHTTGWFKSYLSNKSLSKFRKLLFRTFNITSEVPQGFILGPYRFSYT